MPAPGPRIMNNATDQKSIAASGKLSCTAAQLSYLAESKRRQGKFAEAKPLAEHALEIRERLLLPDHPDHPDLAETLETLGGIESGLGDEAKAAMTVPGAPRASSAWTSARARSSG